MAITTVSHPPQHAGDAQVNNKSGFSLRGRRLSRTVEADPEPPFAPDAQSRWVRDRVRADLCGELSKAVSFLTQQKRTAASPTDLDGSRPAYLLRRLALLALDLEIDPDLTFRQAVERLQWAWDMLLERAAEQEAFERHAASNKAEAEADGALLFAAARRGSAIGPDSPRGQVAVAEVVDRALKAPEPTALQVALTDEVLAQLDAGVSPQVVEAAVAASPVHTGRDATTPPLPDAAGDTGSHEPLPHRTDSFEARLDDHGALLGGEEIDAEQVPEKLGKGALWLTHRGRWHQIVTAEHAEDEQVRIHMVGGLTDCPHFTARVHVLTDAQAQELRGQGVAR